MTKKNMVAAMCLAATFTASCDESSHRIAVKNEIERQFQGREELSFGPLTHFTIGSQSFDCMEIVIQEANRINRSGAAILLNRGDNVLFRRFVGGQSCESVSQSADQ